MKTAPKAVIWVLWAAFFAVTGAASGVAAQPAKSVKLSLYDGPPQGTWRPIADMLKKVIEEGIPGASVSVQPGGGASNVIAADSGKADLAMVVTSATYSAWVGEEPFEKPMQNLRQVAVLYPQAIQNYTLRSTGIRTLSDLRGKRVGVQPKGYAAEVVNRMVLKAAGMSYADIRAEHLGEVDAANALRDGRLDAVMAMGNVPYSVIVEVAAAKDVFLIPLPDDVMRRLLQANRGLWRFTVPAGTYRGQDQPYRTLAAGVHIVARKDLPDDVVEQVTRVLVESLPKFQEQFAFMKATTQAVMAQNVGIPFHPGAEKYYRSKGLLK